MFKPRVIPPSTTRLSEEEVRKRLALCADPQIVDELYETGKDMIKETIDRIKSLESKAATFAAYGTAIVTLLVSSSSAWSRLGNGCSLWIAFFAAVCGLSCTMLCIQSLSLRIYEVASADEWLDKDCLTKDVNFLKQYRILAMWGIMDSHIAAHEHKSKNLRRAEVWLTGSVAYLVFLLFQLALSRSSNVHWLAFWQGIFHQQLWVSFWQYLAGRTSTLGDWGCLLILILILGWTCWRIRSA